MEFPHLGKHCSEKSCNKLDFLPMKCDACNEIFCSEHFSYARHSCLSAHKKDIQVPVCPLCGDPVPTPRGVTPDQTVGEHIDQFCKSQSTKIFTNRCTYKNCKKKELVPFQCSLCKLNFCLKHRHSTDHECMGPRTVQRNLAAQAAEQRKIINPSHVSPKTTRITTSSSSTASSVHAQTIQGNMSEDEALARALALSIMELDESADRNRRNQRPTSVSVGGEENSNENKDRCSLS